MSAQSGDRGGNGATPPSVTAVGTEDPAAWLDRLRTGDRRVLARVLTWVESDDPRAAAILRAVGEKRRTYVVGVTGPPGVGKSTLVDRLAVALRTAGETIGILAVDPSSPLSGGAILGDRVRMDTAVQDRGVFVRSLASRGQTGGLARAVADAVRVMDAAGKTVVLIETVGAGQSEVDIMTVADTVIVVLAPGLGDEIQALKAGILEIADIVLVNKGDRPGADAAVRALRQMLHMGAFGQRTHDGAVFERDVPVLQVSALANEGLDVLVAALREHRAARVERADDPLARRRAEAALRSALVEEVTGWADTPARRQRWREAVEEVARGRCTAREAARSLLRERM